MANYVSPEDKEFNTFYKISYFWVTNRDLFKRIIIGIFVAIDVVLFMFVAWTMLDSFVISHDLENNAVVGLVTQGSQEDLRRYSTSRAANDLIISSTGAVSRGEGKYDYFGTVSNPNRDWWAIIDYHFESSAGATQMQRGFILPSEADKPFVSLSEPTGAQPGTVAMIIDQVDWQRIDHHITGDYAVWYQDRLSFDIEDIVFDRNFQLNPEEAPTKTVGRVSFSITNNSAFSYYDIGLFIVLKRGNAIVGIDRTIVDTLEIAETVDVVQNWFGPIPNFDQVEIIPEVFIFDEQTYKPIRTTPTIDSRL